MMTWQLILSGENAQAVTRELGSACHCRRRNVDRQRRNEWRGQRTPKRETTQDQRAEDQLTARSDNEAKHPGWT
jgi:hypothetical protein